MMFLFILGLLVVTMAAAYFILHRPQIKREEAAIKAFLAAAATKAAKGACRCGKPKGP